MRKFHAILVEDEVMQRRWLSSLLESHFPDLELLGEFDSVEDTLDFFSCDPPPIDLLFLDIELRDGNAFDLLNMIPMVSFQIIVLSAHERYALSAFKINALDYLLKPFRLKDLRESYQRFLQLRDRSQQEKLKFPSTNAVKKLVVPQKDGCKFIPLSDILYCRADANYTQIHLLDGKTILSAKTLKEYGKLLEAHRFLRIHQSFLVNIQYIEQYLRTKSPQIVMKGGVTLKVSRSRKEEVSKLLSGVW